MDSKTSSDEDPTAEGLGRSYECVFCKRGFTTAQALGGHMNIHRKERANKTRPSSAPNFTTTTTTSTNADTIDQATSLRSYPAIHQSYYSTAPDHDDHHLDHPHHHVNYRTYIPAPTWVVGPPHAQHPSDDHEEEDLYSARNYPRLDHQSLFTDGQDSRSGSSLSLGIGPSSQYVDDDHHPNKQIQLAKSASCTQLGDAHELDLELRLGHDP